MMPADLVFDLVAGYGCLLLVVGLFVYALCVAASHTGDDNDEDN
jgi:hypothetical protein